MNMKIVVSTLMCLFAAGCTTSGGVMDLNDESTLPDYIKWVAITGPLGTEGGVQIKITCEYVEEPGSDRWEAKRCFNSAGMGTLQTVLPTLIKAGAHIVSTDMIVDGKLDIANLMADTSRQNTTDMINAQRDISDARNETMLEIAENSEGDTWNIYGGTAQAGAGVDVDVDVSNETSNNHSSNDDTEDDDSDDDDPWSSGGD